MQNHSSARLISVPLPTVSHWKQSAEKGGIKSPEEKNWLLLQQPAKPVSNVNQGVLGVVKERCVAARHDNSRQLQKDPAAARPKEQMTKDKKRETKVFNAEIAKEKDGQIGESIGSDACFCLKPRQTLLGSTSLKGALLGINCACTAASPLLLLPLVSAANYTLNAVAFCCGAFVLPSSSISGHLSAAFLSLFGRVVLLDVFFCNPPEMPGHSAQHY